MGITITSCSGDEPSKGSGNNPSTQEGSIYGIVTDSETAEPMRSTGVELYKFKEYDPVLLLKTVTYDDGHFEFEDLLPGYYLLKVDADGYEEETFDVEVEAGRTARADMRLKKLDTKMTVITESVEARNDGTAVFKGKYNYNGYSPDEYGFIYGQNPNPSMDNGTTVKTDSKMTVEVTGLQKGVWYVRAYAKNKVGYAFGNVLKFEISGNPEVSTQEVSNITDNSATLNGLIAYEGDPEYTEKGFVYSSSFPNPTIDDPQSATTKVVVSGKSKEFSAYIADLTKGKKYYVRAYVKSDSQTFYGEAVNFIAESPKPYYVLDNLMVQLTDLSKGVDWYAAKDLCEQSRIGGFSDWRLPTIGELSFIYAHKEEIGGFEKRNYWSSSTYGQYYYVVAFGDYGKSDYWGGQHSHCVRAVRSIK